MSNTKPDPHSWLDKIIEEQKGQRTIMDQVAAPYDPAELCEAISKADE